MACKSPAHRQYAQAVEGLYVQAHLANLDLIDLLKEIRIENPSHAWDALLMKQHKLDEVVERIKFGQSELAEATRVVNAHFERGCSNVR